MNKIIILLLVFLSVNIHAQVNSGDKAPSFNLENQLGNKVGLSDFKGKIVVLEWYNKDCPFVRKHYGGKNMQNLQKKWTDKEVVWLSIISSSEGKQGYLTKDEAKADKKASGSGATHLLLDPDGTVGRLYEAKTTPHMYVIDKSGVLVYQGAIDSNSSYDPSVIPSSKNYVDEVLSKLVEGKKVKPGRTQAYGCGVKY